jgi:trehalose/maltose hydrolase-like predicted phosphorylase
MQYFGTVQGAVCTAIHNMLLQSRENEIRIFPAIPPAWEHAKFHRLLAAGLNVSAEYDKTCNRVDCTLENNSPSELTCRVRSGNQGKIVSLEPEEARQIQYTGC